MLAAVSTAQVPRLSPACLPGSYAADTTTRSGMTSSGTSPDMRLGFPPPRLVARNNSDGHSRSILAPLTPPYPPRSVFLRHHTPRSPAPAAPRPNTSSFSVSVSPLTHGIPAVLRWPARGWSGRHAASFRGTRNPGGGVCLGSGYRAEPASRGRGFCLSAQSESGAGFYLDPCTVGEMVFGGSAWGKGSSWLELFGSRGARCCVDF